MLSARIPFKVAKARAYYWLGRTWRFRWFPARSAFQVRGGFEERIEPSSDRKQEALGPPDTRCSGPPVGDATGATVVRAEFAGSAKLDLSPYLPLASQRSKASCATLRASSGFIRQTPSC